MLERVLEVDIMLSNRNLDRYKFYCNLLLIVIILLNATLAKQQLEQERVILILGGVRQIDSDSDEDVPDLIDDLDR